MIYLVNVSMKNSYIYLLVVAVYVLAGVVQATAKPDADTVAVGKEDGDNVTIVAATEVTVPGTYGSGMLPAASTPGRVFTLVLAADNSALLTADYRTGDRPVVEKGTWTLADGRVSVTFTSRFNVPLTTPTVLHFVQGDGVLTLVDYDYARWGALGLTLTKAP